MSFGTSTFGFIKKILTLIILASKQHILRWRPSWAHLMLDSGHESSKWENVIRVVAIKEKKRMSMPNVSVLGNSDVKHFMVSGHTQQIQIKGGLQYILSYVLKIYCHTQMKSKEENE